MNLVVSDEEKTNISSLCSLPLGIITIFLRDLSEGFYSCHECVNLVVSEEEKTNISSLCSLPLGIITIFLRDLSEGFYSCHECVNLVVSEEEKNKHIQFVFTPSRYYHNLSKRSV